jgi:hypothetical protein
MPPYLYSKFADPHHEIRLLTLLPGELDDPIRITISHTSLTTPQMRHTSRRMRIEELQRTLPPGWEVSETYEGWFIFNCGIDHASWTHPNANFDRTKYESLEDTNDLEFKPKYEALSYTWGLPGDSDTIYIENSSPQLKDTNAFPTTIEVRRNLSDALRYLRYPDKYRTLWVDALSINQADDVERNIQVGRMVDIFKCASSVVIWLGKESENSQLALSTLRHWGSQVYHTRDNRFGRSPDCTDTNWWNPNCDLPFTEETWQALDHLAKRSYFKRLWVLQEVSFANTKSTIHCGADAIPWNLFRRGARSLYLATRFGRRQYREIVFHSILAHWADAPLRALLSVGSYREHSDPRDRVYGVLGLAAPGIAKSIRPNYSSPIDAYKDAVLAHLNLDHRLHLLQDCSIGSRIDSTLPSWANWSDIVNAPCGGEGFHASGNSSAHAIYSSPNILEVTGVVFSTAHTVAKVALGGLHDIFKIVGTLELAKFQLDNYPTGESMLDAYLWTLFSSQFKDRYPNSDYATFQEWRDLILMQLFRSSEPDDKICGKYSLDFNPRRLWLMNTDKGYIGLTSEHTRPGEFKALKARLNS